PAARPLLGGLLLVGGAIALHRRLSVDLVSPVSQGAVTSQTVQLQRTLPDHSGTINDLLLFVDGLRLVSASADKTIRLWDLATGQPLQTWDNQTSFVTPFC
ncbi:MAG: hypothetical protein AAFY17_17110, partial [Cyanobacteria bacterium J06642_11]